MIDYSTLWQKGNEVFSTWHTKVGEPMSEHEKMAFISGFIQGYLFINQMEVV
jgi:branched-subunit amino acid permease